MAKALLRNPKQSHKIVLQQMPLLTMFHLLKLLEKIPSHYFSSWMSTMAFQKQTQSLDNKIVLSVCISAHNFVKNLNVANDVSERALGLPTMFKTRNVTSSRKQHENLRSIVSKPRQTICNCYILWKS